MKQQNSLKSLFRMKRKLEAWYGANWGHEGGGSLKVLIQGYSSEHSSTEDGETYHYPETIEIKIENRSNYFFSYRLKDGRFVREGSSLNGVGLSVVDVYRLMAKEQQNWRKELNKRSNPKPRLA